MVADALVVLIIGYVIHYMYVMYNNIIREDGVRVDRDAVQLELHSGWTTVASRRGCLAQSVCARLDHEQDTVHRDRAR